MNEIRIPKLTCSDEDMHPRAELLLTILNKVLSMCNAAGYANEGEDEEALTASTDISLASMAFAVTQVSTEMLVHIKHHDGYECAESIADEYTEAFRSMLIDHFTSTYKNSGFDIAKFPFNQKSPNQELVDNALAELEADKK